MSTPPSLDPVDDGLPAPRRQFAIGVLLLSLVLVVLDSAIANVALPSIAQSLGAHPSDTVWVVSSYQLAVLVALLPCGALGEIYGPRRVFLLGVALFTLASTACALAGSLPTQQAPYENEEILTKYPWLPQAGEMITTGKGLPAITKQNQLVEIVGRRLAEAVAGAPVQEAMDAAAAELAELL